MTKITIDSAPTLNGLSVGTLLLMVSKHGRITAEDGSTWLIAAGANLQTQNFPELAIVFGVATASFRLPNLKDHTRPPLNYYIKVKDGEG